jgi:3-phenylpropionate/trans-cinnamate dioxygenase ferredoxin reductase subunit
VALSDGGELACDAVLVAIGVEPVLELVPGGPTPPVFACGDATGGGHWTRAAADAAGAARRLLGLEPPGEPSPFFWSDQFGLRLQLVGDTAAAERVEIDGSEESFVARYRHRDGRLVAALASNRPAEVGPLRRELALAA